jgi:hypothetical protein
MWKKLAIAFDRASSLNSAGFSLEICPLVFGPIFVQETKIVHFSTPTSLIKGHARLFFSRKKSSLPSDFLSCPFIIAYPFIREVRVKNFLSVCLLNAMHSMLTESFRTS